MGKLASIFGTGLETILPPPFNIIFKLLDSKWTWIIAAALGAAIWLHGAIQTHDARIAQAALANQQVTAANKVAQEAINERNKSAAQSKATLALVQKQRTQEQIRNAQLSVALDQLRTSNGSLVAINGQLRSALERAAGRHFTSAEKQAVAAETGHGVVSLSRDGIKALIHDLNSCADYVEATRQPAN